MIRPPAVSYKVRMGFIISLTIILLGYMLKRTGLLKETDGEGISRVVFNLTLPSMVINTFSTMKIDASLFALPVASLLYGLVMTTFALFVFRKESRKMRGMFSMLVPSFNVGLFGYPLVEAIWGREGLKYFGMFDMGNSIIVFGTGYMVASIFSDDNAQLDYKKLAVRALRSVPFLTYIVTLVMNVSHIPFPKFLMNITEVLAKGNMPLSLLLLGIYLNFRFKNGYKVKMLKILAMRYIPGILTGVVLYSILPFSHMFRITMLLGFSLPVSLAVVPYSVQFDYDSRFVGTLNNATIIISFILMWVTVSLIRI
jgi:predicted permease